MPRYEHWYRPDRFEHGYDQGYQYRRLRFAERPWVGGYREDFQGGSGGVALGTSGEHLWREWADQRYGRDFERLHGRRRPAGQPGGYGRDFVSRGYDYRYDRGYGGPRPGGF